MIDVLLVKESIIKKSSYDNLFCIDTKKVYPCNDEIESLSFLEFGNSLLSTFLLFLSNRKVCLE